MTIDVSSILKENGGRVDIDGYAALSDTEFLGEYHFKEPLHVWGSVSNNGKSLILRARAEGSMQTSCARCMKDITVPVGFDIDENLVVGESAENVDEDVIVLGDAKFDADDIVFENFLMNVEGKYLCGEDCRGLCANCGKDLNEGECDCAKQAIDPRWSQLLDIMKDNE